VFLACSCFFVRWFDKEEVFLVGVKTLKAVCAFGWFS